VRPMCVCQGGCESACIHCAAEGEVSPQLFRGIKICLWQRCEHVYARSALNLVSSSCVC